MFLFTRFALTLIVLIFLTGCDGRILNHYSLVGKNMVDGTYTDSKVYTSTSVYPKDNLNHLNNRRKRDDEKYFASSKMYIDKKHEVVSSYLDTYEQYLKVDAYELEKEKLARSDSKNGTDDVRKMEFGNSISYPMRDNILIMQSLKDNSDMVAIPDCIEEFFENDDKNRKKNINGWTDSIVAMKDDDVDSDSGESISIDERRFDRGSVRDEYVDSFLSWNGSYTGNNQKRFTEKPLD